MIDLKGCASFGIAGNFAEHLEQAGESADFVDVAVDEAHAPKGIFPFYLPGDEGFLGIYPLSDEKQRLLEGEQVQMEPEMALLCELEYDNRGLVCSIKPTHATAYNDCSLRRKGAKKISQKKNWGAESKGICKRFIAIDTFSQGGVLDHYRIASFIKRKGALIAYGQDSEVLGYSYFYERLIEWMVKKFQTQSDQGPLEAIGAQLQSIGKPKQALISIGATRYTAFGERHYLEANDELFVALYDGRDYTPTSLKSRLEEGLDLGDNHALLHQKVVL